MVCIYCSSPTGVINSRHQRRVNQVWRRRECLNCKNVFTTHETVDLSAAIRVSYTARDLRPFSRDLLLISIYDVCKHRFKPLEDATGLTQTVIELMRAQLKEGVVSRDEITVLTSAVLQRFDKAAATMYDAFHKVSV